ncbi:MAG: hypothetical protein ACTHL5_11365 [Rhodanobacter sp.]
MKFEITRTVKTDRHIVKLLSPTGIGGVIRKPGSFVECSPLEATDLIGRKRAVAATEAEAEANAADIIVAPVRVGPAAWVEV